MPRTPTVLKTAAGAAATVLGTYGLLFAESMLARRRIGFTTDRPPRPEGVYGDDAPGAPIRLLILGDSTAVGYGMTRADQTPPALAAIGLSHVLDRPVDVRSEAVVGARSRDLAEQVALGIEHRPELVLILIGANDVTHQVPPIRAARQLADVVRDLRANGAIVVVGTCPDLGTVKPMPPPLRQFVRQYSRRLAKAQTQYAVRSGARCVSLADLLEPIHVVLGEELFGDDRFHPSARGYENLVGCLVAAAAASWREAHDDVYDAPLRDYMPLDHAASEAAENAGTHVLPEASSSWASVERSHHFGR